MSEVVRFFAATDVGRSRDHNEDNFLVDKKLGLFVVADGMGGHAAGEVASAIAVRTVHEEIKRERDLIEDYVTGARGARKVTQKDLIALLEHAVQQACSRIHDQAQDDAQKRGMGTTLSLLLVVGQQGFIAHVGDSRIYMQRAARIEQVTEDHTVINELLKRGRLTREQIAAMEQKNAITRAVGVYERVEADTLVIEVLPGDTFVLASDGLTGYLETAEDLMPHLSMEGDAATKSLIKFANDKGGKDNITVVVVKIGKEGVRDEAREAQLALKRDVLAKVPLFMRLAERELLRVMQAVEVRSYKHDQPVIREGEKDDEVFIVLKGTVKVKKGDATLTHLGVGELLGEMALIRNQPRSATAVSEGTSELLVIRRGDFFEILRTEHELAVKLLWQFLGVLADRLEHTSSELRHAREELGGNRVELFPVTVSDPPAPFE